MTLHVRHFASHQDLTDFINVGPDPETPTPIDRANILKIDADSASGGWVIWWWA